MSLSSLLFRVSLFPRCKLILQNSMCSFEWPGRLKCLATGLGPVYMNPGWLPTWDRLPALYSYMRLTGKGWTRPGDLSQVGSQPGFV